MKITVIGAGNVGATCVNCLARKNFADQIILLDIKQGIAEGKALDIWQSASIHSFKTKVIGVTNDYEKTKNSKVVVITSGVPRKSGMSRADLISINAKIVKSVIQQIIQYSPDAIILVVSNPLDVMTYVAYLASKTEPAKVLGMAGVLDVARYKTFIATELNISPFDINALLLGGHGPSMVPLVRYTNVSGIPVSNLIKQARLKEIVNRTREGGTEIVKHMNTSAWYAPGAATAEMVETIAKNTKRILPSCAYLNGEYGINNIYFGVPARLGKNGVEEIIEVNLNESEQEMLTLSANEVKKSMLELDNMNLF